MWVNPEEFGDVAFQFGGLHVMINFLRGTGQQIEASGLENAWTETGMSGPNLSQNVLEEKYTTELLGVTLLHLKHHGGFDGKYILS